MHTPPRLRIMWRHPAAKIAGTVLLAILLSTPAGAGELVVKTYPDGIRDDGLAYLYTDRISTFAFYLFNEDKPGGSIYEVADPVNMKGCTLQLTLPEGMEVRSYGNAFNAGKSWTNDRREDMRKEAKAGACVWTLSCGDGTVQRRFRAGLWGSGPTVASLYHIYVYLQPSKTLPGEAFEMPWSFQREGKTLASGTARVKLIPGPKGRNNPKRFELWTGVGFHDRVLGQAELAAWLDLVKECGATHIGEGGIAFRNWDALSDQAREFVRAQGFQLVDTEVLSTYFGATGYPKEQMPKADENYQVNLNNLRVRDPKDCLIPSALLWCPTVVGNPGSEIFQTIVLKLKEAYAHGLRVFYVDWEKDIYTSCFCPQCRALFAEYIHGDSNAIMRLNPFELIDRYTLEWYKFRSWQVGRFYANCKKAVIADCPDIRLGLNSVISYSGMYTKGLGYGAIRAAEDARFTDFGVDFHNADTLKGGLQDINGLDLFFRPQDSYGVKIEKPVIGRAGAFCCVNWHNFCTLMGKAWCDQEHKLFGCDKRGELLKLAIANMAALGARGVETDLAGDITDALVLNQADMGMAYVAEFEEALLDGKRLPDTAVEIFDVTREPSPYHDIAAKSYYDKIFFYGAAQRYGFIQYKAHQHRDGRLICLFNWDLYQTRKVVARAPDLPEGAYHVNAYVEGERFQIGRGQGETWSAAELSRGISVDLPAAGVVGLWIAPQPRPDYKTLRPDAGYDPGDMPPIDLYAWRGPMPNEPTTDRFNESIYNDILHRANKGAAAFASWETSTRPDVVPAKYFKAFSTGGVQAVPSAPLGSCPYLTETPKIDGRLDDPVWKQAAYYADLRPVGTGTNSACHTEVFLFRDHRALYFAFRCEEPLLTQLVAASHARDTEVAAEDRVAMLVAPAGPEGKRYLVQVNAAGAIFDASLAANLVDPKWNADLTTAVGREDKAWTCEIRIPFAALNAAPPKNGQAWHMNFSRFRAAHTAQGGKAAAPQEIAWSAKPLMDAQAGALVYFRHATVQPRISFPATLALGQVTIKGNILPDNLNGSPLRVNLTHWTPNDEKREVIQSAYPKIGQFAFGVEQPGEHVFVLQIADIADAVPLYQSLPIRRRIGATP